MKYRFSFILLTLFFVMAPVSVARTITLELSIASAFAPYADTLLESPAYAALAFQNSGTPISLSRQIKILSPKELQIGAERLLFENKKGNVYRYKASIGLPFGTQIAIPVEVDVSNLAGGKLKIRAFTLVPELVPIDLIVKVESKIQSLANNHAQKNLIDYLATRTKGSLDNTENKSKLYSQITFDAINQINFLNSVRKTDDDIGRAESLSDQWQLIIAFAIWIIGLPIGLYLMRRHRLRNPNPQSVK